MEGLCGAERWRQEKERNCGETGRNLADQIVRPPIREHWIAQGSLISSYVITVRGIILTSYNSISMAMKSKPTWPRFNHESEPSILARGGEKPKHWGLRRAQKYSCEPVRWKQECDLGLSLLNGIDIICVCVLCSIADPGYSAPPLPSCAHAPLNAVHAQDVFDLDVGELRRLATTSRHGWNCFDDDDVCGVDLDE